MVNFHAVAALAVPVTAVIGLIWLLGRRKPKKTIYRKPDSKSEQPVESSQNGPVLVEGSRDLGSSDVSDHHEDRAVPSRLDADDVQRDSESNQRPLVSDRDGVVVNGHIENVQNHKKEQRQEDRVFPGSSQEEPLLAASSSDLQTCSTAPQDSSSLNASSSSQPGGDLVSGDVPLPPPQESSVNSHSPVKVSEREDAMPDVAKSSPLAEPVEVVEELVVERSSATTAVPPSLQLDSPACVEPESTVSSTALEVKGGLAASPLVHTEPAVEASSPPPCKEVAPAEKDTGMSAPADVKESLDEKEQESTTSFKQNFPENKEPKSMAIPPEPASFDAGIESGEEEESSFAVSDDNMSSPVAKPETTELSSLSSRDLPPCDSEDVGSSTAATEASISPSSTPNKETTACDSGLASISNHTLASVSSSSSDHTQYGRQGSEADEVQDSSSNLTTDSVFVNGEAEVETNQTGSPVRKEEIEEMAGEDAQSSQEQLKPAQSTEEQLKPLTVSTSELGTSGDPVQSGTTAESPSIDSNSVGSNDSGRGGSVAESAPVIPVAHYEFYFPTSLCGRLIGKQGRNIKFIKEKSGANLTLKDNSYRADVQICIVEGTAQEVQKALELVRRKFPKGQYPDVDTSAINMPQGMPVLIPRTVQVTLPACVNTEVLVSNIVDAGHLFVTIPGNPTYPSLEELERFMTNVYSHDRSIPWLPRPMDPNVICAAPWNDRWYRVQVVRVIDDNDCEIMYLDHGYYDVAHINQLRQIRQDFMSVPFQAIECYMGNISPLNGEECFSQAATDLLSEMTAGQLMQAQIVGTAEDGCSYIHLRASVHENGIDKVKFINLELVSHNVVQWVEILPNV